jgi:hypothetical protein
MPVLFLLKVNLLGESRDYQSHHLAPAAESVFVRRTKKTTQYRTADAVAVDTTSHHSCQVLLELFTKLLRTSWNL